MGDTGSFTSRLSKQELALLNEADKLSYEEEAKKGKTSG